MAAMKGLALVLGIMTSAILAPAVAMAGGDGCTCRYNAGEVFEGQTACIRTSSGSMLARCEKVLNNTSWKMLNQPCPTALLDDSPIGSHANPAVTTSIRG
ncbi:MAG: hypothetical protein LJE67_06865 [Salaquimonas sp.]|jgi:hypothetical protein|nr:hypothetical protein [Salaquimonas sp.]